MPYKVKMVMLGQQLQVPVTSTCNKINVISD